VPKISTYMEIERLMALAATFGWEMIKEVSTFEHVTITLRKDVVDPSGWDIPEKKEEA